MGSRFQKASKRKARARVALIGPSGTGKTYSALQIATGIGGKIALIDTENESASKYADRFNFDSCALDEHSPKAYVAAIRDAEKAGYNVLVIDSLSHAWTGRGGALEMADKASARAKNSFAAWREVTPHHNELVDALIQCKCHLIVTMRSKTEYVLEEDARGKKVPRKVGMAPVQRDGLEYEFDIVAEVDNEHRMIVSKSRCFELADEVIIKPGADVGAKIGAWLSDGVAPAADTKRQPARPATDVSSQVIDIKTEAPPVPGREPGEDDLSPAEKIEAMIQEAPNIQILNGVAALIKREEASLSADDVAALRESYRLRRDELKGAA